MEPIEEKNMPATAEATAELFDDIDAPYFMESGFDATDYELQKMLGMEFEIDELEKERFKLKRQVQVVSKKVSSLIMKNSLTFSTEVKHYSQIQSETNAIVQLIQQIRSTLGENRRNCRAALGIVANHRNQKYLMFLKRVLATIKTLHDTEYRLKELIQDGDFPAAIQICVEVINAAQRYKHFTCVRQLSEKLAKILESMESHLDDALAALTIVFDYDRYSLVHSAYQMLRKLEGASQKLQTFFRATIESSARSMVLEVLKRSNDQPHIKLDSMSYEQLCEAIPLHELPRSVADMSLVMIFKVLCLYHSVLRYHVEEDERLLCAAGPSSMEGDLDAPPIVEKGVFQKSLLDNLYPIFKCAANKFNILLCCHDLAALKFDDFIEVVEISNRFRKFGRKHFGNCCSEVALTLEKQTNTYFARYHLERMDELKMFLENEIFALCPVSVQFTLFDLAEFHFLKESTDSFDDLDEKQARVRQVSAEQNACLGEQLDFVLLSNDEELNPFLITNIIRDQASLTEQVTLHCSLTQLNSMERSSSEESCYSKNGEEAMLQNSMPNLCNTALNLLRFIGKYIRMTSMLHSVAEQAILAIIQLYKYFLFSIYTFFCSDSEVIPQSDLEFSSLRLRNTIEAIRRSMTVNFSASCEATPNEAASFGKSSTSQFLMCQPSPCIQINSSQGLFALAERIVGVESVIFLSKQLELLRPVLESLIKMESRNKALDDFYKQILPIAIDLRVSSYGCVASRALNYAQIVKQMINVNWEVQELQSQHNAYADHIINEIKSFERGLAKVGQFAHISQELKSTIWTCLLSCVFRTLVQGNSEASKKCSNEGRALMLLDFELLTRELEATTQLRPLPHKSYLENYIKAFYLPLDDLDEWIVHHTEYTVNQVTTLLNSSSSNAPRNAKSRLITMFENKDLVP